MNDQNNSSALNGGMHASIFVKIWGDAGGGDAGRIALAEYAFDLGRKAALADRVQGGLTDEQIMEIHVELSAKAWAKGFDHPDPRDFARAILSCQSIMGGEAEMVMSAIVDGQKRRASELREPVGNMTAEFPPRTAAPKTHPASPVERGVPEETGSRLYSWLVKASKCGLADVEAAANLLKDYYEGASPQEGNAVDGETEWETRKKALRATYPEIAGEFKVFEVLIETEIDCKIEDDEYGVVISRLIEGFVAEDDFSKIKEAIAEEIGNMQLPEEGQTAVIAYESGEREDVYWNKFYRIGTQQATTPANAAAANGDGMPMQRGQREAFEHWFSDEGSSWLD